MNTWHPNGLKCLELILTCVLENICSGVLLAESCGLGELLRASLVSLVEYVHRLVVIHLSRLVDEYTSSVQVSYHRSFILFSAKILVKYSFTPANVSFFLSFSMLVASHIL